MTLETIENPDWQPCEKTKEALRKRYMSTKQYNQVRREFIRRYWNKQVQSPSTVFLKMFAKMQGADTPRKKIPQSEIDQEAAREQDLANKPDNAKERAEEAKIIGDAMSDDEAIEYYEKRKLI